MRCHLIAKTSLEPSPEATVDEQSAVPIDMLHPSLAENHGPKVTISNSLFGKWITTYHGECNKTFVKFYEVVMNEYPGIFKETKPDIIISK